MASSFVDDGARGYEGSEVSGRDPNGFVPNEELGEPPTSRLARAPGDADALDCSEDGTVCFACSFVKTKAAADKDPFNLAEVDDAYGDLLKLIEENYAKGISNPALVDLIFKFYNEQINHSGDYPAWSKVSISRHLLYHRNDEDVMMNEAVNMLYAQIQSLRTRCWVEDLNDGTVTVHKSNMTLLASLTKCLTDTCGKRKQLRS